MLFSGKPEVEEFEAAALPHLPDLFRTAAHLLGNRTDAEDLAQEVYLEAWKSFHRFEPGTNCRAWLFKILFHRMHHYRRKWFNWRMVKSGDELIQATVRYEPPVSEQLTDEEVLAALDKLKPEFRAVLLLADVEEFAYKEVAEILGIPIGTVMSRLSRARKQMRGELAGMAVSMGFKVQRAGGQGV